MCWSFLVVTHMRGDAANHRLIVRVTLIVRAVACCGTLVGQPVNRINVRQTGQTAGVEDGAQPFGCNRQVARVDEAAKTLTERRPRLIASQLTAHNFRIAHNLILSEQHQVVSNFLSSGSVVTLVSDGLIAEGTQRELVEPVGSARPALVQQNDAVVLEHAADESVAKIAWTGAFNSGTTLHEH